MNKQTELQELLSFAQCSTKTDVLDQASKVAKELIHNWKIVSPSGERRFWGLEFYVFIPNIFEDRATHKRTEQLESGTFYFHTKSQNGWTPPIFNRHGLDITCGDEKKKIYGGILLRHLDGEGHRDGSGLALRSIVRGDDGFNPIKRGSHNNKWSHEEIQLFQKVNGRSIWGNEIYLEHAPLAEEVQVLAKTRIGIENTNYAHERLRFIRE